jgi:hypothetical protein
MKLGFVGAGNMAGGLGGGGGVASMHVVTPRSFNDAQ